MIDHVFWGRVPTRLSAAEFSSAISKLNREALAGKRLGIRYSAAELGLSVKTWRHMLRAKIAESDGENVVTLGARRAPKTTKTDIKKQALKGAAK